ncbi:hypothetical protein EIP86_001421 [Pleurotus ostreatoroseus]|nr:hypothetical protein EIP86_001421 [Pleurotus ostreatoroseus]
MWGRDLEDVEGVLRTPFGDAHEVPLDFFFETVLPPPPSDVKIEAVLDNRALRRRRVVTKDSRWWGYSKKKPGNGSDMNFPKNYHFLERGIRRVVDAVKKAQPIVKFHVNQKGEPLFDNRTDDSLPDAFFLTTPLAGASVRWENIAVIGELMRFADNDGEEEVAHKVVSSMAHCMRADPCRRFIYAFTVENERTRLWYGDRSQVLVTEPFYFIENYHALLSFVVRVSFARPDQLGWDPTMERVEIGDQAQYQITVHSSDGDTLNYRTLGVLSDSGASRLLSRGTRVWKAVRIVNGEETGEPVALKDVWVDSDREREGDALVDAVEGESPPFVECESGSDNVFVSGASAMHAAGWVHRDLSAGNILVVEGRGRIHDLEFATDDTHPERIGRTGTADFVAVEVDKQDYLFTSDPPKHKEIPAPRESKSLSASSSPTPPPRPRPTWAESMALMDDPMPEFRYNPLHDMESLWWNAIYFTLNREIHEYAGEPLSTSPDRRSAQQLSARKLFYQLEGRLLALKFNGILRQRLGCLHPILKDVGNILEEMRLSLRTAYTEAEKSIAHMDSNITRDLRNLRRFDVSDKS